MKKFLLVLLALTMCLTLCACGGTNKEDYSLSLATIVGCWQNYDGSLTYGFDSDMSFNYLYVEQNKVEQGRGTYIIEDNKAILTVEYRDNEKLDRTYTEELTYENGSIKIGNHVLTKQHYQISFGGGL